MNGSCVQSESQKTLENLVDYLSRLIGVKYIDETDKKENNKFLLAKIYQNFKYAKLEEISLAFDLAVKGELGIELYRMLDYKVFCDVMKAYEEYKKDKIGHLVQNQKLRELPEANTYDSNSLKSGLIEFLGNSWELAKANKINELTGVVLYDYLKELKLITLSRDERLSILNEAKEYTVQVLEDKRKESDIYKMRDLSRIIQGLSENSDEVIFNAKRIGLKKQIQFWIKDNITLEAISNKIKEANI